MNNSISVNYSILKAIPINRKVKSSFVRYYLKLAENNGGKYAVKTIKGLREAVMAFIADPDRHTKLPQYVATIPFKKKGLLNKLLRCALTQPHNVLNLLKLYVQPSGKPLVTVEEASQAQEAALALANSQVKPVVGTELLEMLAWLLQDLPQSKWRPKLTHDDGSKKTFKELKAEYREDVRRRLLGRYNLFRAHYQIKWDAPLQVFESWWYTFRRILRPLLKPDEVQVGRTMLENAWRYTPRPVLYKDFKPFKGSTCVGTSATFQKDLFIILMYNHLVEANTSGYDPRSVRPKDLNTGYFYYNLFAEYTKQQLKDIDGNWSFGEWLNSSTVEEYTNMRDRFDRYLINVAYPYCWFARAFLSEELLRMDAVDIIGVWPSYAEGVNPLNESFQYILNRAFGDMHFIPKKGTNDRRPIAAPNRFIQAGLMCFHDFLQTQLRRLPRDATFNQKRFDKSIMKLLNNPNSYVGSVDLSKATDNLPFDWFLTIMTKFSQSPLPDEYSVSWQMFRQASRGNWSNLDRAISWQAGQPLGTEPSFGVLGVTHNLILEAISVLFGRFDSPYFVLGDDVVITSKAVRDFYIDLMERSNVPLSLHKSYDGRLTEFAGKIFIRGQPVLHCSDHLNIHWINLFDYQRSTGMVIPWRFLPGKMRQSIKLFVESIPVGASFQDKLQDAYERVAEVISDGYSLRPSWRPSPSKVYSFICACIQHDARGWVTSGDPEFAERRLIYSYLTFSSQEDLDPQLLTRIDKEYIYVQNREQASKYSCASFSEGTGPVRDQSNSPHHSDLQKRGRSERGIVRSQLIDSNENREDRGFRSHHFLGLPLLNKRFSGFRQQVNFEDTFTRNKRWFKEKYRPVTTEIHFIMAYAALQVTDASVQ